LSHALDPLSNMAYVEKVVISNIINVDVGWEGLQNDAKIDEGVLGAPGSSICGMPASPRCSATSADPAATAVASMQLDPGIQLASPTSLRSPTTPPAAWINANTFHDSHPPTASFCVVYNGDKDDPDIPLAPPPRDLEQEYKRRRLVARLKGNSAYTPRLHAASINTMHKKVADKIHPMNADVSMTDGSKAPGDVRWKQACLEKEKLIPDGTGPFDQRYLTKRFSSIKKGSRLTKERLAAVTTGLEL
jgi:hypothetical protein